MSKINPLNIVFAVEHKLIVICQIKKIPLYFQFSEILFKNMLDISKSVFFWLLPT